MDITMSNSLVFTSDTTYFTIHNNITTLETTATNKYTYLTEISKNFRKFCFLAFFLVGTIGNVFTMIVLSLKKNRGTSTSIFLMFLAASDTVILFTSYLSEWLTVMWNIKLRELNSTFCKINVFLTYYSLQFSSWILVLVTCERCISVINPAKVKLICDRKKGLLGLGFLSVFIAFLNGHWLVGLTYKYNEYTGLYCAAKTQQYLEFLNKAWPIIDFCMTFAVPCIIIMVGNTVIILKIAQASRARSHMVVFDKKKNMSSLTVMLIILNIIFIISMAPASIYLLSYYMTIETHDDEKITRGTFIFDVVNSFAGINATVNFILYFLSGSKLRADVRALFCCKRGHVRGVFDPPTK